jgi:enoyl-CoA hydratase/carnithine racemase
MNYQYLKFESHNGIGVLTLNRPEQLNALSLPLVEELCGFFSSVRDDYQTRVIIMRGAGSAFCAGADLKDARERVAEEAFTSPQAKYKFQQMFGNIVVQMREAPQPLIAAVHGPAVGGGLSIALACDTRIAGESARFSAAFIRIGVTAGDMGASYFLPRLVGLSRAAEILYTGRFIDAATADRIGLVSCVVPDDKLDEEAMELARDMVRNSPFGLRLSKELLNQNIDAPSLTTAIHLENRSQALCLLTEDCMEGILAFLQKREAQYHDR